MIELFTPESGRKVRRFSLITSFLEDFRGKQPKWGPVGYFTYKRCVETSTPVLCGDLMWRPAGGLTVGQGVVGFDEFSDGEGRHIRNGVVTHNHVEKAETVGVKIEGGMILYATPDHEWLVRGAGFGGPRWCESKDLCLDEGTPTFLIRSYGAMWVDGGSSSSVDTKVAGPHSEGIQSSDFARVIQVFPAGERDIAVLSTSLKTHFTGGFASHNTYARPTCDCNDPHTCGHPTEDFWQTCQRVVEGVYNVQKMHCRRLSLPWDEPKAQKSAQEMYRRMWAFKFTPPGRGLAQMGAPYMFKNGGACLNSCAFVSTENLDQDFAGPFAFLMDMSMLGVGVGADTDGVGKVKIQTPRMNPTTFVVPDHREGWVDLVSTVLNSFVGKGSFPQTIDFSGVRSKGQRIRGFGGTASGPGPLAKLVKNLATLLMPEGAEIHFEESFCKGETEKISLLQMYMENEGPSYRITSGRITDIFNMIGACVVAGGVRRTAELMVGQFDDDEFRALKDPTTLILLDKKMIRLQTSLSEAVDVVAREALQGEIKALQVEIGAHPLRSHRWTSNNSIFGKVGMDYTDIGEAIAKNGEPGILWLDNMQRFGRMIDPPNNKDRRAKGANPCFAGDTLIATADGRGAVSIKQLVEEGNDVPVYSMDPKTGVVEIKMARNPRMTRESSPLVEITLDDDSTLRVTPDHKMYLLDGTTCPAEDLKPGDSLPRFQKRLEKVKKGGEEYVQVEINTRNPRSPGSRVFEHRLVAKFHEPDKWASLYDESKQAGWVKGGLVVHHKDYNPLNNSPDNLEIMTFRDHAALHGSVDNKGAKNPMWGKTYTTGSKERCSDPLFLAKLSASHTAAERDAASKRMSTQKKEESLAYYKEQDARTDLDTVWMGGRLYAVKACESCGDSMVLAWRIRGQSYCSHACVNRSEIHTHARKVGQAIAFVNKQRQTLHHQVSVFKDLEQVFGRTPLKKEWESTCREKGVVFRLRPKGTTSNPHALMSFSHLKEVAADYNHRVKTVRHLDEEEAVYNLSVDGHHTVAVVTQDSLESWSCVFCANCAEQTLESYECCCLVETYPAHHDTYEDFQRTLKFAYLYAKTVTLVPTHDPRTNAVMNRNRRIGCSMSGIRQSIGKIGRREFLNWSDRGYKYIAGLDGVYSDWLGIPRSIKSTSVKPSGCRPWYALTSTDQGLLTLEDLFTDHPADQEWAEAPVDTHALGSGRVTKTYNNGVSPLLRITTSYGISVESTPNHQWWVEQRYDRNTSPKYQLVKAWRRADEIQPGDILDIQPGIYSVECHAPLATLNSLALNMRGDATEIRQPSHMNPRLAWLLGYLWGDGAMSPCKYRLRWVDAREENLIKAQAILVEQFGLVTKIHKASEGREAKTLEIGSKHLWHWLIRNDVFKLYAGKIDIIPRVVRASSQEDIVAFLAGLLDADGCTSKAAEDSVLIWTSANEAFTRHVQDVALAVGVVAGCSHITGGTSHQEHRSMFHLTASGHTTDRALEMLRRHSTKVVEHEAREDFCGWRGQVAGRIGAGLILGKVLRVEDAGEGPTYDVEVEGTPWYYAGAVKSHNTVSLLCGATPGLHPPHSPFYIRNIRVNEHSPLRQTAINAGYKVEKDAYADATFVISFPVKIENCTKGKRDVGIWEQVALAVDLQRYWADNQVSCTVTFTPEEASEIPTVLEVFEDRLKAISFLPLREDSGYVQAPYIEITEDEYNEMTASITPMDLSTTKQDQEDKFCTTDTCTLKWETESLKKS